MPYFSKAQGWRNQVRNDLDHTGSLPNKLWDSINNSSGDAIIAIIKVAKCNCILQPHCLVHRNHGPNYCHNLRSTCNLFLK